MQVTTLNPVVLTGQGGGGSSVVGVANPAPGVGAMDGGPVHEDIAVPFDNPGDGIDAEALEPLSAIYAAAVPPVAAPAPSPATTDGGPSNEPASQYGTIFPIPKG